MPSIMMRLTKWGGFMSEIRFMQAFVSRGASRKDIIAMMKKLDESKDVAKCRFMTEDGRYWVEDDGQSREILG